MHIFQNFLFLFATLLFVASCSDTSIMDPHQSDSSFSSTLVTGDQDNSTSQDGPISLSKKGQKMAVCHVDQETGEIKLISVGSENAVQKHLTNHEGDGVPGDGYTDACEIDAGSTIEIVDLPAVGQQAIFDVDGNLAEFSNIGDAPLDTYFIFIAHRNFMGIVYYDAYVFERFTNGWSSVSGTSFTAGPGGYPPQPSNVEELLVDWVNYLVEVY